MEKIHEMQSMDGSHELVMGRAGERDMDKGTGLEHKDSCLGTELVRICRVMKDPHLGAI